MLIKDGSAFRGMFSLDDDSRTVADHGNMVEGPRSSEGQSDENPIRLHGDTDVEFSDLMWSLYALYVYGGNYIKALY